MSNFQSAFYFRNKLFAKNNAVDCRLRLIQCLFLDHGYGDQIQSSLVRNMYIGQ